MRQSSLLSIVLVLSSMIVTSSLAADWERFIESAGAEHGELGRRAAEFLAEHRPERDADLELDLLNSNLAFALRARREFPWAASIDEAMFFNDVLPYASLDETREPWRPELYERCRRIVGDAQTSTEAAQRLNRALFNEINVHYNTGRKKPNQNISESVAQGRATCTGLSIILVNACRSVGIPARIAGVANWADKRGNHTWVEIWDDGWHFTGADEYAKEGLNRAWFVRDAGRAVPGSEEHAVWASSWRTTGHHFPMVWDRADRSVPAVDATERYLPRQAASDDEPGVFVRVWATRGGARIEAEVRALDDAGESIGTVITRSGRADLNDMPRLAISPDRPTLIRVEVEGQTRLASVPRASEATQTIDLFFDELGLTRLDAERLLQRQWDARTAAAAQASADALDAGEVTVGEHTLRIKQRSFGDAPAGERSLWISMHGGGGAPAEVNDRQWQNQIGLYEPEEGLYIAPRAPTDTWNLWHRGHIDPLFDKLIDACVVARGVDPNRVYLMGYSAGGDGVYQLAPRMADRFAAAAMMAGHPNETQPLGLRNLPFALLMGGDDSAYNRNEVAEQWAAKLDELRSSDPDGYPHRVLIYEGLGHWMHGRDAEILPWLASHTRDPWPSRVVWHQDDVTHQRFYWLGVDEPKARTTVEARVDGQRIEIQAEDLTSVSLRLRDELIDLDRPVTVTVNNQRVHHGHVMRTAEAIEQSLEERLDRESAATARLIITWGD